MAGPCVPSAKRFTRHVTMTGAFTQGWNGSLILFHAPLSIRYSMPVLTCASWDPFLPLFCMLDLRYC